MLAFLDAIEDDGDLRTLTAWNAHTLTGDREGTWSLSVTRNRRLTFWLDDKRQICDLHAEDYRLAKGSSINAHEEPAAPRRTYPNGSLNRVACPSAPPLQFCTSPALPVQPSKRQGGPVRADGITHREGICRQDGYANADANYDIAKTRSREKEIKGIRRFQRADTHPH